MGSGKAGRDRGGVEAGEHVYCAGEPGAEAPRREASFVREGPGKRFIEPRLLFLLKDGPAHGYELMSRMPEVPLPGPLPDAGAIYRKLREMEEEGLVVSRWVEAERGPARRVYSITPEGRKRLEGWVQDIKERLRLLERFVRLNE
jgi:DNA-binding PadR family transcriptional regulator